jgi:chromosome segregation ATPase
MARLNTSLGRDPGLHAKLAQLEQQLLTLGRDMQTLDSRQEGLRTEAARTRSELQRRLDSLEQASSESGTARERDASRLSACEQRISGLASDGKQDREAVAALEQSVAETTHRLETRNQQIKFLQDSAREQLGEFRKELAGAYSRLESRDEATNRRLDEHNQQVMALENSLQEVLGRIGSASEDIGALQQELANQRLHIEQFLDSATAQLEVANNRATLLEKRMLTDAELREHQLQQLDLQLRQQKTQLVRIMVALAVVALLATAAMLL